MIIDVDMFECIDMMGAIGCSVELILMVKYLMIYQDSLYRSVQMAVSSPSEQLTMVEVVDMFEFIDMMGAIGCSVESILMVKRQVISQDTPCR